MSASYHIADEPRPSALAEYAVRPMFPLLAMMLGGSWLGLPWFAFNGVAIGSATRRREAMVVALAPVAAVALALVSFTLIELFGLPERAIAYAFVFVIAVKLGAAYYLYQTQLRSFEIYEHFGGRVRNGLALVAGAAFLRGTIVGGAFKLSVWLGIVVL